MKQWQLKRTITIDTEVTCLLSISPQVLLSGEDGSIRMWDADFNELHCLKAHTGPVLMCWAKPNLLCTATRDKDQSLQTWKWEDDIFTNRPTPHRTGSTQHVLCLAHTSKSWLLSGHSDYCIAEWTKGGSRIETLNLHEGAVNTLCVLPTEEIVSGSDDASIKVSAPGGRVLHQLRGHTGAVRVVIVGTGSQLISGSQDCSIKLWA